MILSEWKTVWDAAVGVFAREPIELQLAIGLSVAFMALMVLEGIRANFVPRRKPAPAPAAAPNPVPVPAPSLPVLDAAPAEEPVMLLSREAMAAAPPKWAPLPRKTLTVNRKRERVRPLAHRPMRPKIQAAKAQPLRREFRETSNA